MCRLAFVPLIAALLFLGAFCANDPEASWNLCSVPPPSTVFRPFGTNFTCTCSCNGTTFLQWLVSLPNNPALTPSNQSNGIFKQYGMSTLDGGEALHVAVGSANGRNKIVIECSYMYANGSVQKGRLFFCAYDRPSPPEYLQATVLPSNAGSLLIYVSWLPQRPPGECATIETLTYTVLVVEPNGTHSRYGPIRNCSYTLKILEQARPASGMCRQYRFSILAENPAGQSDPSKNLTVNVPPVPQTSGELTATFSMSTGITIRFEKFDDCSVYFVQLDDVATNQTELLGPYPSAPAGPEAVLIRVNVSGGVRMNAHYNCRVVGSNAVGNTTTPPVALYTTDVQSVVLAGEGYRLNVTCSFAEGTRARGCVVYLRAFAEEVVTKALPRINGRARGVMTTELPMRCYEVSVGDWEEDGTFSAPRKVLKLPVTSNSNTNETINHCNDQILINSTSSSHAQSSHNVEGFNGIAIMVCVCALSVTVLVLAVSMVAILRDPNTSPPTAHKITKGSKSKRSQCDSEDLDKGKLPEAVSYCEPVNQMRPVTTFDESVMSFANQNERVTAFDNQNQSVTIYDNVLIKATLMQQSVQDSSSSGSHYNFLQRLFPGFDVTSVGRKERQRSNYSTLFKQPPNTPHVRSLQNGAPSTVCEDTCRTSDRSLRSPASSSEPLQNTAHSNKQVPPSLLTAQVEAPSAGTNV